MSRFQELEKYSLDGVVIKNPFQEHLRYERDPSRLTFSDTRYQEGSFSNWDYELEYRGLKCHGYRPSLPYGDASEYVLLCKQLSELRHLNIVPFLGIFFENQDVQQLLPILTMEFLPTNLAKCINQYGVLPMEISCSILYDVSLGLNYLHNQNPPIIHQNLTTKDILLSSNMTAKITVNLPRQRLVKMTRAAPFFFDAFMPPEALTASPTYDTTIDVFSFGVVMIHVFSGEFPIPTDAILTTPDGKQIPVSEADHRKEYLNKIRHYYPLKDLILECIDNDPLLRGRTEEIVQRLKDAVVHFPPSYANKVDMLKTINVLKDKVARFEVEEKDLTAKVQKIFMQERGIKTANVQIQTDLKTLQPVAKIWGAEVFAQTTLIVTNTGQHFPWKGYGLTLHFPDGCLPAGEEQCTITIMASLAGQYEFSEDSHLVSAVYWLGCKPRCKFVKNVSVQIEHCAPKKNTSKLSFVRSDCTLETLSFKKLSGPVNKCFSDHSSYGHIEVNRFSGLAITQDGSEEREYCAGLYYLEKIRFNPVIHFVIYWNIELHHMLVQKHYKSEGAVKGPVTSISFEADAISLNIPKEGAVVSGGWKLFGLTRLIVTKKAVDHFRRDCLIPHCQIQALPPPFSDRSDMPALTHELQLNGAKQPFDLLTINFIPHSAVATPEVRSPSYLMRAEKPKLKDLLKELTGVADRWEDIGIFLDMDEGQLATVKANNSLVHACLCEMLRVWLKRVSPPPSWAAVVEAIDSLGTEPTLALELRRKYILTL